MASLPPHTVSAAPPAYCAVRIIRVEYWTDACPAACPLLSTAHAHNTVMCRSGVRISAVSSEYVFGLNGNMSGSGRPRCRLTSCL